MEIIKIMLTYTFKSFFVPNDTLDEMLFPPRVSYMLTYVRRGERDEKGRIIKQIVCREGGGGSAGYGRISDH